MNPFVCRFGWATLIGALGCARFCLAASITFSLANPGGAVVSSGSTVTVEVRGTFDAALVATRFQLTATGDVSGTVVNRSANPTTPGGLTYISQTSHDPFEDNLPHDLSAEPINEVLCDLDYDGEPGGSTDGIAPGADILLETLDVAVMGAGTISLSITSATAAHTQGPPSGQLFDDISIDPVGGTVTIDVESVPPDFNGDGDVDQDDYQTFEGCSSGPAVPHDGSETCQQADFDDDNDVDQSDFGILQRCYSGEGNPADPNCASTNSPPTVTDPSVTGDLTQGSPGTVTVSCTAIDSDGTVESAEADLSAIGGSGTQVLTEGVDNHWEWSGTVTPPNSGEQTVTFTATDDMGAPGTAQASITVAGSPPAKPSPRGYHYMTYDSARGVTVLFGGSDGSSSLGDTWEWDGTTWTLVTTTGPSPRANHAMAYDSARGVTILFGGYTTDYNGETWEWDGTAWTQRIVSGPSVRLAHKMAYDSARSVAVLFGGYTGPGTHSGETWEWDGTAWTLVATTGPSPRGQHAMTYDSGRGVTVLFGGYTGGVSGETWEWHGTTWTLEATTGPPPRQHHDMAYDSARGVTVLFGGNTSGTYDGETWEWDGSSWTQRATSGPSPRHLHAMAFDSSRGVTVLFGGGVSGIYNDETWEWDGTAWMSK